MIIQGHALTELRKMESDSIDCVVTSPPYWSLRKYDIPDVIFDGVEGCEHDFQIELKKWHSDRGDGPRKEVFDDGFQVEGTQHGFCSKCGAWRGQLGLEPTFDLYLKHLLEIFDEVKRVLKKEGTCWVNLGDSYSGSGKAGSNPEYQERHTEFGKPSIHGQRFGNPTTNCNSEEYELRDDLTQYEINYVLSELAKWKRNTI